MSETDRLIAEMRLGGYSLVMNWGEDTNCWEVDWISGGKRFRGVQTNLIDALKEARANALPPVDRSNRCTTDGKPLDTTIGAGGQQANYSILCDDERAKGFVRPVRRSYKHLKCGSTTTMGLALAETYARDPKYYTGTFCANCGAHFSVGEGGEFVWDDGSKVGT